MRVDSARKARKSPAIGFLAARFDEAYQHAVWTGAVAEAERLGAALVFFGGQRIGSPIGYEALDNIAFDLAEHSEIAGLIVMSNVIGTYISNEEQIAFLGRFRGMELVTVGIEFPGVESVRIDASGGMSSIAEHLVRVHGRSRFLFLAGPKGHIESEARKAEFLRRASDLVLGSGTIDVLYGDFSKEEAYGKVTRFLESGGQVDAIVAANDLMAFGAMTALADRGIEVPRAVSVTGFDDTEDSRFSVPPLTTVRQPAAELGRMAVRRMAAKLGLAQSEPAVHLPVSFVIRESCGCLYAPEPEGPQKAGDGHPITSLATISSEVNLEIREGRNPGWLRRRTISPELRDEVLLAVAEGECRYLASQSLLTEKRAAVLGEIEASLVSSFRIEVILKEIARSTRELGMSGCWLSLFESKGASPEWSKLFLAADGAGVRILAPCGMRFRTAELIPGGLPGNWSAYVCEPLCFGDDRLGYLICTADSTDRRVYNALRDQVSSAIKGAMLMAAERDRERNLERNVRIRTLELSMANARLVDEMARRKNLERELLEISNLIMGDIGRDLHDNLCQDIAVLGIMAAVLEGKLVRAGLPEEAEAAAAIARRSGETAAKAKGIARGLYPAELEAKGIVSAVERLVQAAREQNEVEIKFELTKGFVVRDSRKALHLYRIVQEALSNAVKHAQATEIRVGLYMDRENVTVEVSDDGIGIPAGAREENGMGLQILKYRASVIGGELHIWSKNQGTTITCKMAR